jgi:hypothetical protein
MPVTKDDIVRIGNIPDDVMTKLIDLANRITQNIIDRTDLHQRDYLEIP